MGLDRFVRDGFPGGVLQVGLEIVVKTPAMFFFRMISVMVLLPLVFMIVYPLVYVVLPESIQRLADIPRDVVIFILVECLLVPLFAGWLYVQRRHNVSETGVRENSDTRDVI